MAGDGDGDRQSTRSATTIGATFPSCHEMQGATRDESARIVAAGMGKREESEWFSFPTQAQRLEQSGFSPVRKRLSHGSLTRRPAPRCGFMEEE